MLVSPRQLGCNELNAGNTLLFKSHCDGKIISFKYTVSTSNVKIAGEIDSYDMDEVSEKMTECIDTLNKRSFKDKAGFRNNIDHFALSPSAVPRGNFFPGSKNEFSKTNVSGN